MVCKEDVLTWFKDLDSYKRIDLLCELINMCLPFELRFLGSYVEETGKHSYQELRQQALAANDVQKLDKDPGLKNQRLSDETVRHRMLINVSLLKSRNYNVANWYSKNFLRTEHVESLAAKEKDELVQNELLLLFTMAARHPAFSFDQKQFYNRIVMQLYELREMRANKLSTYRYPPGFEHPNVYRNIKANENVPFPMGVPVHPNNFQQNLEYLGPLRAGWAGMPCCAPSEVPIFSHPPPQPAASPLVSSPNQSRCGSPRQVSRPPTFSMLTSTAPTVSLPAVNLAGVMAPGMPGPVPSSVIMAAPVTSCLQATVPIETLGPPPLPLGQSGHPSPVYNQSKPVQSPDNDESNTTLKEESPLKPLPPSVNPWVGTPNVNPEGKPLNGLRIATPYPPVVNLRNSIADQFQSLPITDESSQYHSSSSSGSPLQTPPETPSNLAPRAPTPSQRGPLDKRVNGIPNYPQTFGDTTSPPPSHQYNYATYPPVPPTHRFFSNPNYRPPATTVYGQFGPAAAPHNQSTFQGGQNADGTPSFQPYPIPCISFLVSSYPPLPPQHHNAVTLPATNQPGCYNCGAAGHLGQDCPQQNIDDITQKNTYSVDFSPGNSDSEK